MSTALGSSANVAPLSAWLLAIRPKTLPAAISPVLVGCAVAWAEDGFDLVAALAAFAVALLLQIGANLANDVADFRSGADTQDRLGPLRVTQGGLIPPRQVVMATAAVLIAAAAPGLYLVWRGGPVLAVLGLLAIAAAVTYTAGPKPFGYLGLGELFVFIFFGPVAVVGTAFVMTHHITRLALLASIAMGCLVTAILVVNNLRDIDTDRMAGKRTLAVRIGRGATRWEYTALIAVAYAMPVMMWCVGVVRAGATTGLDDRSPGDPPCATGLGRDGRGLNPVLGGTARLCLWFAVTFGSRDHPMRGDPRPAATQGAIRSRDDVRAMFDRIVPRYDLMNRLMTGGRDIAWRRLAVREALRDRNRQKSRVLDVATGTGDLALALRAAGAADVVGLDFSAAMLDRGDPQRSRGGPATGASTWVEGDAMSLPFADESFDAVTVAFGLRNMPSYPAALREMSGCCAPRARWSVWKRHLCRRQCCAPFSTGTSLASFRSSAAAQRRCGCLPLSARLSGGVPGRRRTRPDDARGWILACALSAARSGNGSAACGSQGRC